MSNQDEYYSYVGHPDPPDPAKMADTIRALRAENAQLRAQLAAVPSLEAREQAIEWAVSSGQRIECVELLKLKPELRERTLQRAARDMATARRLLGLPVET